MKILKNLMKEFYDNCTAGQPIDRLKFDIQEMDIRMRKLLQDADFDPRTIRYSSVGDTVGLDVRRDIDLLNSPRVINNSPAATIPSMVRGYYKRIRSTVSRDLLASIYNFSFGEHVRFGISVAPLCVGDDQDTEKFHRTLRKLQKEGYVIKNLFNIQYFLVDCAQNRKLLRDYCVDTFGAAPMEIYVDGNDISCVYMDFDFNDCRASNKFLSSKKAALLKEVSSKAVSTLTHYFESGKEAAPYLALLRNSIHDIELLTGVHGYIWADKEKEVLNRNSIGIAVNRLENLAAKFGMVLDWLSMDYLSRIDISLSADRLNPNPTHWVHNDLKSKIDFMTEIQDALPSSDLTFGGIVLVQSIPYVTNIRISADGDDIKRLLRTESTVGVTA